MRTTIPTKEENATINKRTKDVTDELYKSWASTSGYLFGFPPSDRTQIEAIVKCIIIILDSEKKEMKKE